MPSTKKREAARENSRALVLTMQTMRGRMVDTLSGQTTTDQRTGAALLAAFWRVLEPDWAAAIVSLERRIGGGKGRLTALLKQDGDVFTAIEWVTRTGQADEAAEIAIRFTFSRLFGRDGGEQRLASLAKGLGEEVDAWRRLTLAKQGSANAFQKARKLSANGRRSEALEAAGPILEAFESIPEWSPEARLRLGQALILAMEQAGWVKLDRVSLGKDDRPHIVVPTAALSEQAQRFTERLEAWGEPVRAFVGMPPLPWTRAWNPLSADLERPPMAITGHGAHRGQLKAIDAERPAALFTALNRLQETPLAINGPVLNTLRTLWGDPRSMTPGSLQGRLVRYHWGERAWDDKLGRMRRVGKGDPLDSVRALGLPPFDPLSAHRVSLSKTIIADTRQRERINAKRQGQWRDEQARRMWLFRMFDEVERVGDHRFFLAHRIDFRGRVYPVSEALTPQGPDWMRALFLFADGKAISTEPEAIWKDPAVRALAEHGANVWGHDKAALNTKVRWVQDNTELLLRIAADPVGNEDWWEADEPFQALAFAIEWALYVAAVAGGQNEFVSCLPCQTDGRCNAIQHLSLIARDAEAAKQVNLVSDKRYRGTAPALESLRSATNRPAKQKLLIGPYSRQERDFWADYRSLGEATPRDLYRAVAEKIARQLIPFASGDLGAAQWPDGSQMKRDDAEIAREWAQRIVPFTVDEPDAVRKEKAYKRLRAIVKLPVMTLAYGATDSGRKDQLKDALREEKANLEKVFGPKFEWPHEQLTAACSVLGKFAMSALWEIAPDVRRAFEALQGLAVKAGGADHLMTWKSPSGLPVVQTANFLKPGTETKLFGQELSLSWPVPLPGGGFKQDAAKAKNAIVANLVHSFDAAHLHRVIAALPDKTPAITIHDGYLARAADMPLVNLTLSQELAAMYAERDWLAALWAGVRETVEDCPEMPPRGGLKPAQVTLADGAFW
jgi:hypothetical protein